MVTVFEEVFVPLSKLTSDPKAPLLRLRPGQQQRPSAPRTDLDRVLMLRWEESERRGRENPIAFRADVLVRAPEHERQIPPGMVMRVSQIIARDPVVNPQRKPPTLEHPPENVRTFRLTKRFRPLELHSRSARMVEMRGPAVSPRRYAATAQHNLRDDRKHITLMRRPRKSMSVRGVRFEHTTSGKSGQCSAN